MSSLIELGEEGVTVRIDVLGTRVAGSKGKPGKGKTAVGAGYYGTVASPEGWAPTPWKSKDPVVKLTAEDCMDEEDLRHVMRREMTRKHGFTTPLAKGQQPQQPRPQGLSALITPCNDYIGAKLLRKMGWREGEGLGPRQKRRRPKTRRNPVAPSSGSGSDSADAKWTAPKDIPLGGLVKEHKGKGGVGGIAFEDEATAAGGVARGKAAGRKRGSALPAANLSSGFGAGFGDEDEVDRVLYGVDDMSIYDEDVVDPLGAKARNKTQKAAKTRREAFMRSLLTYYDAPAVRESEKAFKSWAVPFIRSSIQPLGRHTHAPILTGAGTASGTTFEKFLDDYRVTVPPGWSGQHTPSTLPVPKAEKPAEARRPGAPPASQSAASPCIVDVSLLSRITQSQREALLAGEKVGAVSVVRRRPPPRQPGTSAAPYEGEGPLAPLQQKEQKAGTDEASRSARGLATEGGKTHPDRGSSALPGADTLLGEVLGELPQKGGGRGRAGGDDDGAREGDRREARGGRDGNRGDADAGALGTPLPPELLAAGVRPAGEAGRRSDAGVQVFAPLQGALGARFRSATRQEMTGTLQEDGSGGVMQDGSFGGLVTAEELLRREDEERKKRMPRQAPLPADGITCVRTGTGASAVEAAKAGAFGSRTRLARDWYPTAALCHKFQAPDPFPDVLVKGDSVSTFTARLSGEVHTSVPASFVQSFVTRDQNQPQRQAQQQQQQQQQHHEPDLPSAAGPLPAEVDSGARGVPPGKAGRIARKKQRRAEKRVLADDEALDVLVADFMSTLPDGTGDGESGGSPPGEGRPEQHPGPAPSDHPIHPSHHHPAPPSASLANSETARYKAHPVLPHQPFEDAAVRLPPRQHLIPVASSHESTDRTDNSAASKEGRVETQRTDPPVALSGGEGTLRTLRERLLKAYGIADAKSEGKSARGSEPSAAGGGGGGEPPAPAPMYPQDEARRFYREQNAGKQLQAPASGAGLPDREGTQQQLPPSQLAADPQEDGGGCANVPGGRAVLSINDSACSSSAEPARQPEVARSRAPCVADGGEHEEGGLSGVPGVRAPPEAMNRRPAPALAANGVKKRGKFHQAAEPSFTRGAPAADPEVEQHQPPSLASTPERAPSTATDDGLKPEHEQRAPEPASQDINTRDASHGADRPGADLFKAIFDDSEASEDDEKVEPVEPVKPQPEAVEGERLLFAPSATGMDE
eukprot:gene14027-21453_t